MSPQQQHNTKHDQHDTFTRGRRLLEHEARDGRANSTSTSARVRTFAAAASANARNQNCDASAPMKPANSDGRQARTIAENTPDRAAKDRPRAAPIAA